MAAGLDDLIADVDAFLVQLAVAHENLVLCARLGNQEALDDWQQDKLSDLVEAIEKIGRSKRSDVVSLQTKFVEYKDAAAAVLRAAKGVQTVQQPLADLARAFADTRGLASGVASAARGRRRGRVIGAWVFGTAVSIGLSVFSAYLQLKLRETERRQIAIDAAAEAVGVRPLESPEQCTPEDWERADKLTPASVSCRVWIFHPWRQAAGYRFDATIPFGMLERVRQRWVSPVNHAPRDPLGTAGPRGSLSSWICNVSKTDEVRVIVWWGPAGSNANPSGTATALKEGEGLCRF